MNIGQIYELPMNFGFTKVSLAVSKGQNQLDEDLK